MHAELIIEGAHIFPGYVLAEESVDTFFGVGDTPSSGRCRDRRV